jgi:hypothetical protein
MNDLDKQVAEARGWRLDWDGQEWLTKDGEYARDATSHHAVITDGECWTPSTDIAQAMELEGTITKDELEQEYGDALDAVLKEVYSYTPSTFQIAHATPEQRCLAYLKAKGKEVQDE